MNRVVGVLGLGVWLVACPREMTEPDALPSDVGIAGDVATSDAGVDASTDGGAPDGGPIGVDAGAVCTLTTEATAATDAGMRVIHHDGQTFVTWRDRAEGEAGAAYRYRLYRSTSPIESDADLADAELVADRIPHHSGQLFGEGFRPENRVDATRRMSIVEAGGEALESWSGLWISTAQQNGCAFYAVVATDADDVLVESVQSDVNATAMPIAETLSARQPLLVIGADDREGPSVANTRITGKADLPLMIELHGSNGGGGPVVGGEYGDYYTYFGDESMGYQDGLPGVFSVHEVREAQLIMRSRDTIMRPNLAPMETYWFGYVTESRETGERVAHPYTENRLDFMIPWVVDHYAADPNRVYVSGGSMGAWGSMTYAARRPELFAAIYPNRPRVLQHGITRLSPGDVDELRMPNGELWLEHHDSVRFVRSHPGDLPFIGWNCGRQDGFATWIEQVEMVRAMSEEHHGFAFAWNNGGHGEGATSGALVREWYPPERFALNESYPAFANSTIDDDLGDGDLASGDLEGGINLGFEWTIEEDEAERWVLTLANALATNEMSVDVTPRRLQQFRPEPGAGVAFTTTRGQSGTLIVDDAGRMTAVGVRLIPGEPTVVRFTYE
ncbi:MAG: hypothetical protein ACI9KE_003846 [Polyangiales bacterium]|jgi:hypothetical protein